VRPYLRNEQRLLNAGDDLQLATAARVDEFFASINNSKVRAKTAADAARKNAAETATYTALALLIGAFIASVSAALGGRLRDEHV
jgi:hypothetical protein